MDVMGTEYGDMEYGTDRFRCGSLHGECSVVHNDLCIINTMTCMS